MAKGDVVMKFDAQTAQFVEGIMKAQAAMLAAGDKARKLGEDTSKAGDLMSRLGQIGTQNLNAMGDAARGLVGNFNFVQMGINAVTEAYDKWKDKIKEVDEMNQKLISSTARLASGMGDAGAGPEVRTRLEHMFAPGVTQEQKVDMFKQAQITMPGANKEELFASVKSAAQGNKAGKDPAALLNTMGRMGHLYPGLSPDQLRDKANVFLEENAGRELDEGAMNAALRFTKSGGGTADEGLGYALAFSHSGSSPATLGKLVDKLAADKIISGPKGHTHSPSARAARELASEHNRFAGLPMADKLKLVMGDHAAASELLGDEDASALFPTGSKLSAAKQFHPDEMAAKLKNSGGSFTASSRMRRDDKDYSDELATENIEEEGRMATLQKYKGVEQKFRQIKAFLLKRGDNPGLVGKVDSILKAGAFAGADPVGLLPTGIAIDFQKEMMDQQSQLNDTGRFAPGMTEPAHQKHVDTPAWLAHVAEFNKGRDALLKETEEQTKHLETIALHVSRPPGGPTLNNGRDGDK